MEFNAWKKSYLPKQYKEKQNQSKLQNERLVLNVDRFQNVAEIFLAENHESSISLALHMHIYRLHSQLHQLLYYTSVSCLFIHTNIDDSWVLYYY